MINEFIITVYRCNKFGKKLKDCLSNTFTILDKKKVKMLSKLVRVNLISCIILHIEHGIPDESYFVQFKKLFSHIPCIAILASENIELIRHSEPIGAELKNIDFNRNVSFKNVDFKYDDKLILNDFNLELQKGIKYAIVGNSGCGKSTIINLLLKFYDIDKGSITIGDTNIKQINTHELRNHITLISQDNQLFYDSIFENIKYGTQNRSKSEIENAMKLTGLDSFLNCTESIIGNEGTLISGGQKQRIAIARGLLKEADIILFDEATSALDSESEHKIFNSVSGHFKGKTIIWISHRVSTIKNVDEIICMDKGRVVEKGTHNNLIALKGVYWRLFRKQIEESIEE